MWIAREVRGRWQRLHVGRHNSLRVFNPVLIVAMVLKYEGCPRERKMMIDSRSRTVPEKVLPGRNLG